MKSGSIRKALFVAAATVALAVLAAVAVIEWRWTRRFDAPYPVVASTHDPATLARGEYIVYAAGACAYCHVPREVWPALDRDERVPLTGHHVFPLPFGDIYSANLTPDRETGIGTRTDGELARVLRFGVRADGRAAVPLMEIHLRDDDLAAVLAYLKSRPAVSHLVPEHALSLFGKALMGFAISPAAVETPRGPSPEGATVERGEYLANHVSSCVTCHTDRGEDGALVGPAFAGGQRMDVAADPTRVYVTPNLTPDQETSPVGQWPEDTFVARFRMGPQVEGSPMPWGAFARMSDDDLRAMYRYLRSLPPTRNRVGPAIQPKARPPVVS